ncbi:MAG TPA: Fur family transcriptional regulator [Chloroflexia bacterium]|nr:Fur family transcriptional regulator [Chloroflexia bacterium]
MIELHDAYSPDDVPSRTTAIDRELRARGHRLTPRRLVVVAVLAASNGHVTGEEVLLKVQARHPSTNKTTVYRTLELLSDLGFLAVTDLGSGRLEYELLGRPHHHLVCEKCGGRVEVEDDLLQPLRASLMERYGYSTTLDHFALFGICPACRRAERADG